MGKYLVGIDEGTTGCKTVIFDLEGKVLGYDYTEYPCYYPKPAWVEQVPEDITPKLFETCRNAIKKSGIDPKEIIAMGLSSQGSVFGPVDKDFKLLRPFIGWQDLRGADYCPDMRTKMDFDEYYNITGHPGGPIFSITKYQWLRDNEPEIWEKTAYLSQHQDYFLREFGAKDFFANDVSSTSRTGLFDVKAVDWSQRVLDVFGFDRKMMGGVANGGDIAGYIPADVAEKTGLPVGTPICVGAHDQNCSTMGCGLVESGLASLVLGTWGSCYVTMEEFKVDPNKVLISKGNVGPNNFTIEGAAVAAASTYQWYRDTFGGVEVAASQVLGRDAYDLINDQIDRVPVGANGITFLPHLQGAGAGPRANSNSRGTLTGINLGTTKAEVARAVMEGITFEMRDILEAQRRAGVDVKAIRLTGGGAKSPMWIQMQADAYQRPIEVLQTTETGTLGAALYAAVGTGTFSSYKEAADKAVKISGVYEPNPKNFAAYDEAYAKWVAVYESLANGIYKP